MEYEIVSRVVYKKCQNIATDILAKVAAFENIGIQQLQFSMIIEYFDSIFKPKIIGFYYPIKPVPSQIELIEIFNNQFIRHNIPLSANAITFVDQIFANTVDGLSTNQYQSPSLFLNVSTNTFPRIRFTCLHEFIHVYLKTSHSLTNSQCETETNIIASLLLFPDESLKVDMKRLSFIEIQKKYGTSRSAMFNRLCNYFFYNFKLDYYESFISIREFSMNKKTKKYHRLLTLLYNS